MNRWWLLQHIKGGDWFACRVLTIFGYPLCTFLFRACGPFKSQHHAEETAKLINDPMEAP